MIVTRKLSSSGAKNLGPTRVREVAVVYQNSLIESFRKPEKAVLLKFLSLEFKAMRESGREYCCQQIVCCHSTERLNELSYDVVKLKIEFLRK
jgi:hypothetical protein